MLKWILIVIFLISTVAALPPCTNQTALDKVQAIADTYRFKYRWQQDVFDCADMSAANWRLLKAAGYDPKIALREDPPNGSHCYVIFPVGDGWAGLDTQRQDLTRKTGQVITTLEFWRTFDTPEEVFAFDIRGPPVIRGEVLEFNLPLAFR